MCEQTVVGYGVRITLRANTPEALAFVVSSLPGGWKPAKAGPAGRTYSLLVGAGTAPEHVLYRDEVELCRERDPERVLEFLVGSAGFYVAEHSPRLTFVHAGAVAWAGRVIVLPGRPESGKTTLTAALVRAGASYLSDDYAPVDDRGYVHPFARPLSMRRANGLPPNLQPVEALGGTQESRDLPVGLVVFAPYTGARRWRPRVVMPGQGVLELLAHTASGQTRPGYALERLSRVATAAPMLKGGRGEADATASLILRRLSRASDRAARLRVD